MVAVAMPSCSMVFRCGIPARYQWGTVDVPVAQAMNWVGGATKPEAALQILNQGGIAARGISGGGQFATVRMEHVWVNAYVNWSPEVRAQHVEFWRLPLLDQLSLQSYLP